VMKTDRKLLRAMLAAESESAPEQSGIRDH